jgi:hypothetical protein
MSFIQREKQYEGFSCHVMRREILSLQDKWTKSRPDKARNVL